jgi:hypothetical protein
MLKFIHQVCIQYKLEKALYICFCISEAIFVHMCSLSFSSLKRALDVGDLGKESC